MDWSRTSIIWYERIMHSANMQSMAWLWGRYLTISQTLYFLVTFFRCTDYGQS